MKEAIITELPIRTVSTNNPGSWIVNLSETGDNGIVVTCFYLPVVNEYFTFREDGLRIEIERFPLGDYLLNGYYVEPARGRKQTRNIARLRSYEDAIVAGKDWLKALMDEHRGLFIKYYPELYKESAQIEMVF